MATSDGSESYVFLQEPDRARAEALTRRLQEFNAEYITVDHRPEEMEIYALDAGGNMAGGLIGRTVWGWLEVSVIWVEVEPRGRGLGMEFMSRAEEEARR